MPATLLFRHRGVGAGRPRTVSTDVLLPSAVSIGAGFQFGEGLLTLVVLLLLFAALPSGSVLLVLSLTLSRGKACGLAAALGIAVADAMLAGIVLYGLAEVLAQAGPWVPALRLLAALYLIQAGVRLFLAEAGPAPAPVEGSGPSPMRGGWFGGLAAGFAFTIGDVKAIGFYAGLLPAVLPLERASGAQKALSLLLMALGVGGVKVAYALLAERLCRIPVVFGRLAHLRKISAVVLVLTGVLSGFSLLV